tara:strand:+ start:9384 stop:11330 length:1947 start_codon:yes stop_codon:yes gene_type:complete
MGELSLEQRKALAKARARQRMASQTKPNSQSPKIYDQTRAGLDGFLEGVPLIGPALQEGADMVSAGMLSLTGDETYGEAKDMISADRDRYKENHSITNKVGNVAGAVAGMAPIIASAPALFGAGGGGLLVRTAASAGSGLALSVADTAVRTDGDIDAMQQSGYWGLGLGALGPVAGKVVGAGVRAGSNKLASIRAAKATGETGKTLNKVARAVADDGLDAASVSARLDDLGPDAMLMDLGPNLKQQGGAIVATPNRGQEIIKTAISTRNEGASGRITSALDDTLGKAKSPNAIITDINSNKAAISELYTEAFKNAKPVDLKPLKNLLSLASSSKRGPAQAMSKKLRKMLFVSGDKKEVLDETPETLLEIRHAIDGNLKNTKDTNVIRLLSNIRKKVDGELARKVPNIKKVDAQYEQLALQKEALSRGQQVLESGKTSPWPSELADEVASGSLPNGKLIGPSAAPYRLTQGARAEIERIVGTNANDRVALQRIVKGEGDWNRSRLSTLFGEGRTDKILKVLDSEKVFADTSHIVTGNSQTAARQAAQAEINPNSNQGFGVRDSYSAGGVMGGTRALGLKAVDKIMAAFSDSKISMNNEELAKILTSNDKERIIKILTHANGGVKIDASKVDEVVSTVLLGLGVSSGSLK